MKRQGVNQVTVTVVVTLITLGTIANLAAAIALKDGDKVNGLIRSNSPTFQFRNWSQSAALTQNARGEEHTLTARRGDNIEISVDAEDGSSLRPILVLLSPAGRQVAYDETRNLLQYQVPTTGTYKLLVLGAGNTLGRYNLAIDGLSEATPTASTTTPAASTTTPAASTTTATVQILDPRRQLLKTDYGLTVLENCPANRGNVIQVSFPEGTQAYEYCATPNRLVQAGKYVYNAKTASLDPERKPTNCTVAIGGLCILK